ncbi:hypothetical protein G6F24_018292 [Rhizopus arrhizus]|nr:hypothetical protein G6F24_018292 [Rhizopus arrhizus]
MLLEALAGGEGHEFVQRTGAVKRADVTAARGGMQFKQQHAIELELGMLTKRRIALPVQQLAFVRPQVESGVMQARGQRGALHG